MVKVILLTWLTCACLRTHCLRGWRARRIYVGQERHGRAWQLRLAPVRPTVLLRSLLRDSLARQHKQSMVGAGFDALTCELFTCCACVARLWLLQSFPSLRQTATASSRCIALSAACFCGAVDVMWTQVRVLLRRWHSVHLLRGPDRSGCVQRAPVCACVYVRVRLDFTLVCSPPCVCAYRLWTLAGQCEPDNWLYCCEYGTPCICD